MHDANYFRQKAQRCSELLQVAILPEVREQLRLWAEGFEAQANGLAERSRGRPWPRSSASGRRRSGDLFGAHHLDFCFPLGIDRRPTQAKQAQTCNFRLRCAFSVFSGGS
jgi:hypothetical protein